MCESSHKSKNDRPDFRCWCVCVCVCAIELFTFKPICKDCFRTQSNGRNFFFWFSYSLAANRFAHIAYVRDCAQFIIRTHSAADFFRGFLHWLPVCGKWATFAVNHDSHAPFRISVVCGSSILCWGASISVWCNSNRTTQTSTQSNGENRSPLLLFLFLM